MTNTVEVHWNFKSKKWNLVEIGTEIKNGDNRSYYVCSEMHFIDTKKSRLVRLAWKIHLFFQSKKKILFETFTNPMMGTPFKEN